MSTGSSVESNNIQPLRTRHVEPAAEDSELYNSSSDGTTACPSPEPSLTEPNKTFREGPAYPLIGSQQNDDVTMRRRRPSHTKQTWARSVWLWEALSIAVAVLTLAAIIVALLVHKGRPLPSWPSRITINTLISVLTAIFKASLMVPIAEGISQLRWLWYLKPRPLGQIEQWDSASRGSLSRVSYRYIHESLMQSFQVPGAPFS